jgi:nitroreductase
MDTIEAINGRTMIREYSEKALTKAKREKILRAGIRAPTAAGNEQWCFVVVGSEGKREALYRLLIEAQKIYYSKMLKTPLSKEKIEKWVGAAEAGAYKAPLYVAIIVDLRDRFCTIPDIEELWAHQSAAAAIENMLLAAWESGIGGCWFGVPLLMREPFDELIGSDGGGLKLAAILSFGYPKKEQLPRPRKKTISEITKVI